MNGLSQDLRYALRQMRKSPGSALFTIAIMALGIAATTAMFSIIHAVLLKPLEYRDPTEIVLLTKGVTPVRFEEMKRASRSYSELGAFADVMEQMALPGVDTPEVLNGARISANFLQILGVSPLTGRVFSLQEDEPGAPAVAMISEKLWRLRFSGDPQISGKTMVLAGTPHTIIGVLPASCQFPFSGLDVWVTKPSELSAISARSRPLSPTLKVFGRLNSDVSMQQANAELSVLKRQYAAAHPGMLDADLNSPETLLRLKDAIVSDIRPKLWMLFGAVGLVLLIVCANVGSLRLARATSRTREFAVRAAIGAGRTRIVRQLLAESVLLAFLGGGIGLALAASALSAVIRVSFLDLPRAGEIRIDGVVFGFAVALSTATAVLFGLAPSLVAFRPDLASVLRGTSEGASSKARATSNILLGPRGFLVASQLAVSIILLIGAVLLIQSMAHLSRMDPGFQPANLLTMHIALSPTHYGTDEKQAFFYEQLLDRVRSLPGVQNAAVSLTLPFTGWSGVPVQPASAAPMRLNERPISIVQFITPEYFGTMEIAIKRGRAFTAHDNPHSLPVAIISETLARHFWPEYPSGPNPVGQKLLVGANHTPKEIVGISADVREVGKDQDPRLGLYLPTEQVPSQSAALIVRTHGNPLSLALAVQRQILAIDPDQPASDIMPMDEVVEVAEGQLRLMTRLLGGFAGAATLLAMVGLYGVISYSVTQRTKEIGIRQALGARRSDILSLVMGQSFGVCAVGVVIGICAAFALTRFLKDLLFQIRAVDPRTFVGVAALVVLLALVATYIPARRAIQVDPMVALRYE